MKNRQQLISIGGVIALALVLPTVLKATNNLVRYWVGAEGRLAAINIEIRTLGPLAKPWLALAQGGQELNTFMDDNATAVAALKPEYIRLDHIYDGYGVVKRSEGGLSFDWTRLDRVVNKMSQIGAKPFLVLSYMPEALAATDLVSEPKNWNEWSLLVQRTIEHYSGTLGIDGVYYEVWNEPDLFGKWTMGGRKDYKNLYLYAANGAAAATGVKTFKLGGPATTGLYKSWMEGFLPWTEQNKLRLDFYSWHRYDLAVAAYQEDVRQVDSWVENHPTFFDKEKIITEMGPNSEAGKENDTKVGAAHLLAVQRALLSRVKYAFDFAISGTWGIMGKPRYEALEMLAALGGQRMPVTGEGTWVSAIAAKNGRTIQVLVVNYDAKKMHSEVVPVNFVNLQDKAFVLKTTTLEGLVRQQDAATTGAVLQQLVPMGPNDAVLVELTPKI